MKLNVTATKSQMLGLLLNPKYRVSVEGRGTGKSFDIGFTMGNIVRAMPRSITAITGKTYGQLLTNTLPSSFKVFSLSKKIEKQNKKSKECDLYYFFVYLQYQKNVEKC